MPCYSPLQAYQSLEKRPNGKMRLIWCENDPLAGAPINLPCGQCVGCRLERSRQWAIRCLHEAQMHEENCFITLTVSPDNDITRTTTLVKKDFQKFMKRLRKAFPEKKISYYYCGEYGENNARPHYHACLFGIDFNDKFLWKETNGVKLYRSEELEKIWTLGYSTIGEVNFESAAYVARYIMKKITGKQSAQYYEKVTECGEIIQRIPEYTNMSLKSPIGQSFLLKYHKDVYPYDEVIIKGRRVKPPRYYDKIYGEMFPDDMDEIKLKREVLAYDKEEDNTKERLVTKHESRILAMKKLRRSYEAINESDDFDCERFDYDRKIISYNKKNLRKKEGDNSPSDRHNR